MKMQDISRDFMPRHDRTAASVMLSVVGAFVGLAILTRDEPMSTEKLLKLAGGAVAAGLCGLLLPDTDPRKW